MSNPTMNLRATMIALILAGMAPAQVIAGETDQGTPSSPAAATTAFSTGQSRVADKFAAPFVTVAGSRENAVALATALRNGSTATLTYTSIAADGTTTTTTVGIPPPTKPMGWGNVSHSLALAQVALNQQGITNPTGAELRAALNGDTIMTADGRSVTFAGVLQQRADGMGFGRIAQSYGTTMGAVNRGIKAPATPVAMTTTAVGPKSSPSIMAPKAASAPGVAAGRGVTTTAGTAAGAGQGAKGLTTGPGRQQVVVSRRQRDRGRCRPRRQGLTTAPGVAAGRGVTTAAGTAAGVGQGAKGLTTAPGVAAGRGVTTAAGTAAGAGQGAKGLTTAAGATSHGNPHGIVSATGGAPRQWQRVWTRSRDGFGKRRMLRLAAARAAARRAASSPARGRWSRRHRGPRSRRRGRQWPRQGQER